MPLQHLRSSTANKRPTPASMSDGQLAINTNDGSPGLFFKDNNGALVKIGPVHVGTTAPNASPAVGGQAGNSKGELWLDTSGTNPVLKIWDGAAWQSEAAEFVNVSGDTMTGALVMDNQQQVRFREQTVNGTNYIALQAPTSVASDKTITLPDVTGTVVTTGDSGTVTSTMIADGTIVNGDINASAGIVDTKLATISTAGKVSNSATTATNANTASAIVARDASGNFTAGTITASLTGAASSNVLKAGDTMTGSLTIDDASLVVQGDSYRIVTLKRFNSSNAGQLDILLKKARGTKASPSAVQVNDNLGRIAWTGFDGTNDIEAASIQGTVDATPGTNDMPGRIVLSTTADGASSPTERARLDSSGRLLIGTTSATGSALLQVNGDALISSLNGGPLSGARNRIINGDMRIDARNNGASVTATGTVGYTLDRWSVLFSQNSKFSVQRNAGSITPPAGFTNYLGVTSLSAYSITSTDYNFLVQRIEGFNSADLSWGSASAQAVTLSFWTRSSLTGTFSGSIRNGTSPTRSYVFSYSITSANTWEYKTVTIPGDTSGSWLTDNGTGITLTFCFGSGTTRLGTAGSWQTADLDGATGATSVVGTNGATFFITGVQLEPGSVATPFERRSYGQELTLCQRYFQESNFKFWGYNTAGNTFGQTISFATTMRAAPSVSTPGATGVNAGTIVIETTYASGFILYVPATTTGSLAVGGPYRAASEL